MKTFVEAVWIFLIGLLLLGVIIAIAFSFVVAIASALLSLWPYLLLGAVAYSLVTYREKDKK